MDELSRRKIAKIQEEINSNNDFIEKYKDIKLASIAVQASIRKNKKFNNLIEDIRIEAREIRNGKLGSFLE